MLQGARHEHIEALMHASLEVGLEIEIVELRKAVQIDSNISALILPGGESTAMRKASQSESLLGGIFDWMDKYPNRPVLGTCARAILLSNPGETRKPYRPATISHNAWTRPHQSFEAPLDIMLDTPTSIATYDVELKR